MDQVLFVDELAATVKESGPEKVVCTPETSQAHQKSNNLL